MQCSPSCFNTNLLIPKCSLFFCHPSSATFAKPWHTRLYIFPLLFCQLVTHSLFFSLEFSQKSRTGSWICSASVISLILLFLLCIQVLILFNWWPPSIVIVLFLYDLICNTWSCLSFIHLEAYDCLIVLITYLVPIVTKHPFFCPCL